MLSSFFFFFFNASVQTDANLKTESIYFSSPPLLPPPHPFECFSCSAESTIFLSYHPFSLFLFFFFSLIKFAASSWFFWKLYFCSQNYGLCFGGYLITCRCSNFVDLGHFNSYPLVHIHICSSAVVSEKLRLIIVWEDGIFLSWDFWKCSLKSHI